MIVEVAGVGKYNIRVDQEILELLPEEQIMAEAKRQLEKIRKLSFLLAVLKMFLMMR